MKQTIEKFHVPEDKKKNKKIVTWIYMVSIVIILSTLKVLGVINLSWFFILTSLVWVPMSIIIIVLIVGLIMLSALGFIGGISERRRNSKSK